MPASIRRASARSARKRLASGAVVAATVLVGLVVQPVVAHAGGSTASLDVEVGRSLGYMTPALFGTNVDWNAQSEFLEPGTTDFYPTFLHQVASIGFGAMRFPGGTLGSYYHWERAIGPLAARQPNTYFGDGPEPSLLGPDEFGTLLDTSNAIGDVIVNPSTGTLAEATAFVAYMTLPAPAHPITDPANPLYWSSLRARDGHPAPYDVPWWEVGNEVNTGPAGQPGWMYGTPVSYAGPQCPNPAPAACLYDFGGTTSFQTQPVGEVADSSPAAAVSNGQPDQTKYVIYPPVVPHSLTVQVAGQPWTEVSSLSGAEPTADVFVVNPTTGAVTFGDAVHGAVPANGSIITASYQSGPHAGFVQYYQAMKRVNPTIHVCLGATSVIPDIAAYLKDLGSANPYDCVPTHPYVRNGTSVAAGDLSNSLPESEYDTELLALPGVLAGQVQHLRAEIDQYAGANASRVTIPITEFGQLRSSLPSFDNKFHYSLEEGILIANELRQWVNLGLPLAEHYLLEGSPFGTVVPEDNKNDNSEIIGPGPNTFLEPTAYVEQLFRALGGERRTSVQAEGIPQISLPDGSQQPALETLAGTNGNHVTLVVINQDDSDAVTATVAGGAPGVRSATVTMLDGASQLSYNSPTDPNAVSLTHSALPDGSSVTIAFPAHSVSLVQFTTGP
jgi:alpha-N-arabinofuranosidase